MSSPVARSALTLVTIVVLCSLRLVHLGADTPASFATGSMGAYIDEGYKTTRAQNLFRAEHGLPLNVEEHRPETRSPVSDRLYLLAFRTFGVDLRAARLVSIGWFLLLMVAYVWGTVRDDSPRLFFLGLLLLGVVHTVFFYSRIALYMIGVTATVYWLLFLIRRRDETSPWVALPLVVGFGIFATWGLKVTAPIYFLPILAALMIHWVLKARHSRALIVAAFLASAAIGLAAAFVWRHLWIGQLDFAPTRVLRRVLFSPMTDSAAFWVSLGLVCATHVILTRPKEFLANPYRASLLAIVLGGPVLVALFTYNPLRYYLPWLPAYLLLPLEWAHLGGWKWVPQQGMPWARALVTLPCLIWATLSFLEGLNLYVLYRIPMAVGHEPGLSTDAMYAYVMPVAGVLGWLLWRRRQRLARGTILVGAMVGLAVMGVTRDLEMVGGFLLSPSYEGREIRTNLERLVPDGALVAGSWAAFFTAGTDLRSVRLHYHRSPERYPLARDQLKALRPSYFLYNEGDPGHGAAGQPRSLIQSTEGVSLGPPIYRSSYIGRKIILYPLEYAE